MRGTGRRHDGTTDDWRVSVSCPLARQVLRPLRETECAGQHQQEHLPRFLAGLTQLRSTSYSPLTGDSHRLAILRRRACAILSTTDRLHRFGKWLRGSLTYRTRRSLIYHLNYVSAQLPLFALNSKARLLRRTVRAAHQPQRSVNTTPSFGKKLVTLQFCISDMIRRATEKAELKSNIVAACEFVIVFSSIDCVLYFMSPIASGPTA